MTYSDVIISGFDYESIYHGAQVLQDYPNYYIAEFIVTEDTIVAGGYALANPLFGQGGFYQYYVPNWAQYIQFLGIVYQLNHNLRI